MYQDHLKRFLDLMASILGLALLWPLFLFVALLVLIKLGQPILFRQVRPGLHGKPFTVYKFRTMSVEYDISGKRLLPDSRRIPQIGRFMRILSLDELPEFFNIVKGNMSLVGPRPLLPQYLERYSPEQMRRHEVRPGMTGWAQVNGRNATTWEERFKLDIWYVNHVNMRLDMKILALTVWKVIKREGINQPGHPTMKEFMGSGDRE